MGRARSATGEQYSWGSVRCAWRRLIFRIWSVRDRLPRRYSISYYRKQSRLSIPGGRIRGSAGGFGRRACGSVHRRCHRFHTRLSEPDYALCLGNDLDAARVEPAHSTTAHSCHRGLAGAMGRVWAALWYGLTHELELCDLKETLLQTAIYAGVPAANTGFQIASEEIEKLKAG